MVTRMLCPEAKGRCGTWMRLRLRGPENRNDWSVGHERDIRISGKQIIEAFRQTQCYTYLMERTATRAFRLSVSEVVSGVSSLKFAFRKADADG